MEQNISIFWFRRDLRLNDNKALTAALNSGTTVLPIFIFDTQILDQLAPNDARVTFINQCLEKIHSDLQTMGSGLSVYYGKPREVFQQLLNEFQPKAIFVNRDYEPYALNRDQDIESLLNTHKVSFNSFKDHVIFEKDDIVKSDGKPYLVYTPFMKSWRSKLKASDYAIENDINNDYLLKGAVFPTVSLNDMGFEKSPQMVLRQNTSSSLLDAYEAQRNTPGIAGTSRLGPHLRFGTVSIRKILLLALSAQNDTFLKELIWREFFMQILWHFPDSASRCFKPKYERIIWRNNPEEFQKWCDGQTGYPLVDAGMRELNATGFMHNRVRMLVGSFLCKHLLIDWRLGEAYFASKLLDYEMSSNVGNWQWVAGCGVDAAPYFRIFNPHTQIDKFDSKHIYIKKWVPELSGFDYPEPMVDHKFARERCLKTYKAALDN